MAVARANPVLLCVNESNIVEVRALPPRQRPHWSFESNEIDDSLREASALIWWSMITRWHRWQVPWHTLWTHLASHSPYHSVSGVLRSVRYRLNRKHTHTRNFFRQLSHFFHSTMLPYMLCLNEIHYREQICLCLSLAGVMSLNPHYKIKSIILLAFTITEKQQDCLVLFLKRSAEWISVVWCDELLQYGELSSIFLLFRFSLVCFRDMWKLQQYRQMMKYKQRKGEKGVYWLIQYAISIY